MDQIFKIENPNEIVRGLKWGRAVSGRSEGEHKEVSCVC
jgi:hypothetical protein